MNDLPGTPHGPAPDDDRLRRLLDDTVSDVEPRESLGAIRSRTAQAGHGRRPWIWGAGAVVVATAATIAAVTLLGGDSGTTGAREPDVAAAPSASATDARTGAEPSPITKPSPATSADAKGKLETVPAYYLGDTSRGLRLFREFARVPADGDPAVEAVNLAIGTEPEDPDYRSAWLGSASATATSVTHSGGTITVDLAANDTIRDRPDGMTEEEASMAIEQVLYTVQGALQSRDPVQLLVNGGHIDQIFGVPTAEPLAQGVAADVLAQVWVIEPAEGAEVTSPFTVTGLASGFEATVQWELMKGDTVVQRDFTMAAVADKMSPYSFTVDAPPGEYTLVVHDTNPSDGEGFPPWRDTKTVRVVP